jgi:formate hydrogenlyase subunit 3/multisubunit Na+/H+ antiporter MnhD subunit
MNSLALLACVCWPMVLAAGLIPKGSRRSARALAPWAALPALLVVALGTPDFEFEWLLLGGHIGLDAIASVLLPVTAGLWLAAGLFAQRYLQPGPRRDRFFVWFLAAMTGNLLLLVAMDAIVFYLGFALMSFASYGLVVHEGDARARHAGRYYITMVIIGEVCIISALMLLASRGAIDFVTLREAFHGDELGRNNLIIGLLIVGFGIKAGVFGLHFWLPLAHPVAPAPASAVLSGAMIKAGLVAWMRLLPLGELALPAWGAGLAALGLFTAYYGVLAGLPQHEAKTVLAYSSVSQMGIMTLAIGLGLAFPAQWPLLSVAVLIYMAHHSLVKGGLFLGAGLVQHALSPMVARIAAIVLSLGALALAGGPLTGGLVAKLALKHSAEFVAEPWSTSLPLWLSASSALTALLMLRFLRIAWPCSTAKAEPLPGAMLVPWLALFVAWLAAPWLLAAPALRADAAGPGAAWNASWPILLAGVIAIAALRLRGRGRVAAMPRIPAGDLGIPLERGVLMLGRALARLSNEDIPRALAGLGGIMGMLIRGRLVWSDRFGQGETRIAAWSVTGLLLLLLAVSFAWLLA